MPYDVPAKWIRTPSDRQAVDEGCWFDEAAAEWVRTFFREHLRLGDDPFALLPWQYEQVIAPLFGWKREDGRRRFTRGFIFTPKKNGKTSLLAGLSIYLLVGDGERSAEVYTAAGSRDQAGIMYREAAKMVRASPSIAQVITPKESSKRLIVGNGDSFYAALSAEAGTKEGLNAHAVLFDELHTQPNRDLWDCLKYAGAARRQPLHLTITTAGSDQNTLCGEQYLYAKRVLSGEVIDTSFLAVVFEAAKEDDWTAEATWFKANPSLGAAIGLEQFRGDFKEAQESAAKENT
ncbi:MAG: Terminase, partial [Phycisphaerales bacterium]|nr:Terminase [Phycisphaerales bacterium]